MITGIVCSPGEYCRESIVVYIDCVRTHKAAVIPRTYAICIGNSMFSRASWKKHARVSCSKTSKYYIGGIFLCFCHSLA